ncbi:MAG: HAMP domain-containing sensor histidine kinase [Thermoleophilia bacterium]|nr:HAMP domain-containing sensor histidine kinase [Thermoleophilia bacterium]
MEAINQSAVPAARPREGINSEGISLTNTVRSVKSRVRRRPLFQKVVIANTILIAMGITLGIYLKQKYFPEVNPSFLIFYIANTALLSIIINYLIVRLAFQPLDRLEEAMKAISDGRQNIRVPEDVDDTQIEKLSRSLNTMLISMERQRKRGAASVIKAQEEERKRIARELHDETSQSLTGLVVGLRTVEKLMPEHLSEIRDRLANINDLARNTLNEVHTMAVRLRPSVLDDLGLPAALRSYVKEFSQNTGIYVDLRMNLQSMRLEPELETVLYRVVQEALTNVARHSEASSCQIKLLINGSRLKGTISDNGRGFDPANVLTSDRRNGGLGLHGMKERIELVGGSLTFDSSPNQGSIIHLDVPAGSEEEEVS